MQNLASSTSAAISGSEKTVHPERSTKVLADRFIALFGNTEDRILMQVTDFSKREQRIVQFAAPQNRLTRIISDRLAVLTSQGVFIDALSTPGTLGNENERKPIV